MTPEQAAADAAEHAEILRKVSAAGYCGSFERMSDREARHLDLENERAMRREDAPSADDKRTYNDRLADGFNMLSDGYTSDD